MTQAGLHRVLVLMATYNGARWIEEQTASILSQRDVVVVLRVSDDCSTDDTETIAHRLAVEHSNVIVTRRTEASGCAGANFKAMLEEAPLNGFDHVALADQDDIWELDHLARACAALHSNPAAGGYSCAVKTFGKGKPALLSQTPAPRALDFLFEGAGQGCTFVMPVSTAGRVQRVCKKWPQQTAALHYHDWMIYLIVRCSGFEWIFDPHASLHYRQHDDNEIGARSNIKSIQLRLALIRHGWYSQQIRAAWALATALAPSNQVLQRFGALFLAQRSSKQRIGLAWLLVKHGRRRLSDRMMLGASTLSGWI